MGITLSVIIPSYKDPLMVKTVDSLLTTSELGDALEIVVTLDGYWPSFSIVNDKRVRYCHLGRNRGMRGALNAAASLARGEYLMRCDEHQSFSQGCDRILVEACQPDWIVTPRRYFLDPVKWERMNLAPVDHMALAIRGHGPGRKFSGVERSANPALAVEESWAMQGSCWLMPRKLWDDVIGELQNDGYGPLYQDSTEMTMKVWQHGGHLMVVKRGADGRECWHAHKHRSFPRTHSNGSPENPSNNEQCWAYALSVWEDYYHAEVEPRMRA